jgi:cell division topological specificity factor
MSFFGILNRRGSAPVARERLQILMAHERQSPCNSDLIVILHKEILAAITKHIEVDADKVEVKLHRREMVSVLEIDVEIDPRFAHHDSSQNSGSKAA